MAKNTKPLLKEGTIRRMMKLANMEALGNGFISEKYTPLQEENPFGGEKDDRKKGKAPKDASQESEDVADYEKPTSKKGKERRKAAGLNEQDELEATEDELGAEDEFADEEGAEIEDFEAEEPEVEGEVTITDEEAQDIIDLADKLRDAVGDDGGGEEEIEFEAEEEVEDVDLEEPATRYEEDLDEDALYEAALKGLQIDMVDDRAQRQQAMLQEVKKRIYKRVVKRLLEGSKPQAQEKTRKPKRSKKS